MRRIRGFPAADTSAATSSGQAQSAARHTQKTDAKSTSSILAASPKCQSKGKGKQAAAASKPPKSDVDQAAATQAALLKAKKKIIKGTVKGGKGKRFCKGCSLYFDLDCYDVNDPYCPRDRPAMRRLQRAANSQGKAEEFKAVKAVPERLQNLLARYHEQMGDPPMYDGQRLAPWSWSQFEEFERAEKSVIKRRRGVMMHEERWMKYAQSVEGGNLATMKAKSIWDEWDSNKEHLRDVEGPRGCKRLYVRTDTEILEDDVYVKGKTVRRGDKVLKNVGNEELNKQRKQMMSNHDGFGEVC